MSASRYALQSSDRRLRAVEPTPGETGAAAAATLAAWYNEHGALLGNSWEFSTSDVLERFDQLWLAGDRPFLLYRNDELVGDGDLRRIEAGCAGLAVMIGPRELQAKGLGTRFSGMVLALAFGPLELHRVFVSVTRDNARSIRMFERLGFGVDASSQARRFADAPSDLCLSAGPVEFRSAAPESIADVRISVR